MGSLPMAPTQMSAIGGTVNLSCGAGALARVQREALNLFAGEQYSSIGPCARRPQAHEAPLCATVTW